MKTAKTYKSYANLTYFIGWSLLALLLFLLIPLSYGVVLPFAYWINQAVFFCSLIGLTHLNTRVLVDKYLFKKKFFQYYLILLFICLGIIVLLWGLGTILNLGELIHYALRPGEHYVAKPSSKYMYFYILFLEILVLGINITIVILNKWLNEEKLRLETEEKTANMELSYLKAQINPHFFFNSLNTINALTYKNVEDSRLALSKLSHIMRYVLYDTEKKRTPLKSEVDFIKDYIELSILRISPKVGVKLDININVGNTTIAPMLLLPFIENCFKHGISSKNHSSIFIFLGYDHGILNLITINTIAPKNIYTQQPNVQSIGMVNTKRRLELLYHNKHTLNIDENNIENEYRVNLKIELL